jgi:hypothetical protein
VARYQQVAACQSLLGAIERIERMRRRESVCVTGVALERKRELLFCCFKMKAFEINKLLELSETRNMQQAHD